MKMMRIIYGVVFGIISVLFITFVVIFVFGNQSSTVASAFLGSGVGGYIAREKSAVVGLVIGIFGHAATMIALVLFAYQPGLTSGFLMGMSLYFVGVNSAVWSLICGVVGSMVGQKVYQLRQQK